MASKTSKGAPAKKAPVKKASAKKTPAKPAAKKPAAKKPAAKKPVAKKSADNASASPKAVAEEKKTVKRVPPRIVKKVAPVKPVEEYTPIDTEKAVAFAMSIALEMKASAANSDLKREREADEIRLSRRPTTRTQGTTTVKFPQADLKMFKKRLLDARQAALSGVNAMKATGFNESDDHETDGGDGTAQTLRLQALGQMGNINRNIQQIDEALHRIDDGTYGVCTICGQLIRKPRLLNQPFVLTCMECQNEVERSSRG